MIIEDNKSIEEGNTPAVEEVSQTPEIAEVPEKNDSPETPTIDVDPRADSKALLDSISEPDPNAPVVKVESKEEAQATDKKEEKTADTDKKETPEAEEAALLDGVKSERGKERIKGMLAERKQAQADLSEFREMVVSTGMSPDQFAQTLEFGRLTNSKNEADKRTALAMLDAARADLVKELGIEAPGVDPFADFPDLAKAVENMEVTKGTALEVAKFRRKEAQEQQRTKMQEQSVQSNTEYQNQIQEASKVAETYFKTRETEADFPAKMKRIQEYFASPANVQEFVANFEPKQWFGQFKFMYDNIRIEQAKPGAQPIRSRPSNMGVPNTSKADNPSRLMSHLDSMGI